ncbi:ABC transporter ATP-binding protein [Planctomonas sp. JC2975]|uniref:ATP-binding cassette domain-containing protein n=1 Tax=Planctomonas sp. JC2975 TaxID=2729626 RepID=UPI001473EECA|nr:ABC transporter ATP-binding protein [Planctomonas sp. JC2975]
MTGTGSAISVRGLTKKFGRQVAVGGLDLEVPQGSVFGFLGPNGSGKTTTIRMLLGLAAPNAGTVELLGERMPRASATVLPRVGALVEGPAFYPFLTGRANLSRLDAADPRSVSPTRRSRVADALDRVGLTHAADKKAHAYSLGMKQRLGLAGALLRPRELLVLDEPSNGLDPQGTREVRSLIRRLADEGATVFVSSHLLSEVEQLCSHVAVMRAGRLVASGSLDELRSSGGRRSVVLSPDAGAAAAVLLSLGLDPRTEGDRVTAELSADAAPEALVESLVTMGVRVRGFEVTTPSLEDRFVELTGEGFDVAG